MKGIAGYNVAVWDLAKQGAENPYIEAGTYTVILETSSASAEGSVIVEK